MGRLIALLAAMLLVAGAGLAGEPLPPEPDGPIDYAANAHRFVARQDVVTVTCPAQLKLGKVYGSGPYAVSSSICFAGVHAGLLQRGQPGTLRLQIGPRQAVKGSRENAVTSYDADVEVTFTFVP